MRAIVINAEDRTIVETEIDGSLDTLQQIVGGMIEPVTQGLDDRHHCYVNEEGLLNNPQHFFMFLTLQAFSQIFLVARLEATNDRTRCRYVE